MCRDRSTAGMYLAVKDLKSLDNDRLYGVYKDIINTSPLDIFVVGDVDLTKLRCCWSKAFLWKEAG